MFAKFVEFAFSNVVSASALFAVVVASRNAVLKLLHSRRFPPVSLNNRVVMFVDEYYIASFGGSELRSIKWNCNTIELMARNILAQ